MDAIAVAEANTAEADPQQHALSTTNQHNGEPENRFQKAIAAWRSM